jgi:hypothetical protein
MCSVSVKKPSFSFAGYSCCPLHAKDWPVTGTYLYIKIKMAFNDNCFFTYTSYVLKNGSCVKQFSLCCELEALQYLITLYHLVGPFSVTVNVPIVLQLPRKTFSYMQPFWRTATGIAYFRLLGCVL